MTIYQIRCVSDDVIGTMPLAISMGAVPGVSGVNKFGTNESVGTAYEDIWGPGGLHVPLPTPTTLEVASTSANDTAAGTGAQRVTLTGHDANHMEITEVVTLNGQTPVVTTQVFGHMYRLSVERAGSSEWNEGILYVADDSTAWTAGVPNTSAAIQAGMPALTGQSQIARYTVPMGKTGFITKGYVTAAANKTVDFRFLVRRGIAAPMRVIFQGTLRDSQFVNNYDPYALVPEMTTIWVQAKVDATTAVVSAGFDMVLVDNDLM